MDTVVCVKHVPETAEADIAIRGDERGIEEKDLTFDINEADNYAIEEALLWKEKYGGSITVITVGPEDANMTVRMCIAKGADKAIRLDDERFEGSDSYAIAKILHAALKDMEFDAVLTGIQASDDGHGQVGPILAQMLGIPHAAYVIETEMAEEGKLARVHRELEGGLHEVVDVELPAVFTIQTGINEPRYASILGIRKATKKEIDLPNLNDLDLQESEVGEAGSKTRLEKLFLPPVGERAQILEGSPQEVSEELFGLLKDKGVI
jgi:electron transfer flavoprotein beta subunit